MIAHTSAFAAYRDLSQAHLNFVVLVCHAVPALRADLALPSKTVTNKPDHFKAERNPKTEVMSHVKDYQEELARSTLITVFSYFESYVKEVLVEIVEFHGGPESFKRVSLRRSSKFIAHAHQEVISEKRKLQDRPEAHKRGKYEKYGRLLDGKGFNFPSDLFAHFGVSQLLKKLQEKRGLRAWEIPLILEDGLLLSLSTAERGLLEEVRTRRNMIAHGRPLVLPLQKSLHYASMLHTLAARVDRHVTDHFLIIQPN